MEAKITSVEDCLSFVSGLRSTARKPPGGNQMIWFRGHPHVEWTLDPTLLREPYGANPYRLGVDLLYDFTARARPMVTHPPQSQVEWSLVARHHGIPTRFLDWTESVATGLYFAARPSAFESDGALWALDVHWLVSLTLATAPGIYSHDHPAVVKLANPGNSPEDYSGPPLAIGPPHISPRIAAQHGAFTLHTFEKGAIERHAQQDRSTSFKLAKAVVPASAKSAILRQLQILGIREATMFPDLDGLAREMRFERMGDTRGF